MSIQSLRIDNIYYAINALEREADRLSWNARGIDERDRARSLQQTARDAAEEFGALSRNWERIKSLSGEADRAYDSYVTRGRGEPDREPESCSCHINPPCGFCTRQSDEEEDAA